MKCPNCQHDNPSDTRFCSSCGLLLKTSEDISASPTETVQTPIKEFTRGFVLSGRYEIIEKLGSGGMGNVYRAMDKKINEEVALKFINPAIIADEKSIERFKNELKMTRKITHRNVCRVYDLSEVEGIPYITMEYIPGEDLKSIIQMTGRLSLGRAIFIAKQVCEGLAEAHRLGVIHRDLKPRNIMMDKRGHVRIMDFGVARSLQTKGITGGGMMIGTPEYMSPEQAKGEKADLRADIYTLGIILFEMVTGKAPFEGDTSLSIALKHQSEIPPDPREFNSQISDKLSHVILKCLEKDNERRYQNAEELFSALSEIEEEISTEERFHPKKKTRAISPRKRISPLFVPGILIALIVIIVGYVFIHRISQGGGMKWKNSIAVLPFEDLSPQRNQGPFCEEMTIAIITKLSSIEGLKVPPDHSTKRYRDTEKDIREIGKELNVKTILVPYLKREEDKITVTAQLVDTRDNFVIKSLEYGEEFERVFEVQDRLSREVAELLGIQLVVEQFKVLKRREPKNMKAYEYYVKGTHFERRYRDDSNPKDFEAAVKNHERAIEIEEDYALAHWGLGTVYDARFIKERNEKDFEMMKECYLKAYRINPDLAEANVGLGWASFYKEDLDSAYEYYKKAYELDPNNPEVNSHIAAFMRDLGLYHKADGFYSRAIELDPSSTDYRYLCASCNTKFGRFEKAASLMEDALELEPDNNYERLFYARIFIMMNKYENAESHIARVEKVEPDNLDIQYTRAMIFAAKGQKEKALAIISGIKERVYFTYLLSNVYALLGMEDEAIQNIQEAIEKSIYEIKTYAYNYLYLKNNHFLDNLRDDSRFKEIVKQQEKIYKERLKKYGNL